MEEVLGDNYGQGRGPGLPQTLHKLLEETEAEGRNDIISWVANGTAFKVHNKEAFINTIMPRYFETSTFKSYQRSVNLWSFTTVRKGPKKGYTSHPLFRRGEKDLCKDMRRIRIKGTGKKRINPGAGTASPFKSILSPPDAGLSSKKTNMSLPAAASPTKNLDLLAAVGGELPGPLVVEQRTRRSTTTFKARPLSAPPPISNFGSLEVNDVILAALFSKHTQQRLTPHGGDFSVASRLLAGGSGTTTPYQESSSGTTTPPHWLAGASVSAGGSPSQSTCGTAADQSKDFLVFSGMLQQLLRKQEQSDAAYMSAFLGVIGNGTAPATQSYYV